MTVQEWEWIFAGQVRGIQGSLSLAHHALVNWGRWSRELGGVFPTLAPPALWDQYRPDDEADWGEAANDTPRVEQAEVKAESADVPDSDPKTGEELDIIIHNYAEFPAIWRRVLKAAYCTREVPEYQFPREAKLWGPKAHDSFLIFFDGALRNIEELLALQENKDACRVRGRGPASTAAANSPPLRGVFISRIAPRQPD